MCFLRFLGKISELTSQIKEGMYPKFKKKKRYKVILHNLWKHSVPWDYQWFYEAKGYWVIDRWELSAAEYPRGLGSQAEDAGFFEAL